MTDTNSPSLADRSPRSYLINGWTDYFKRNLSDPEFDSYMRASLPRGSIKEVAIAKLSDTVVLGEKKNLQKDEGVAISGHYFMDLLEGVGNDADQVERGCHSTLRSGTVSRSGGSNFAFADGSARFLKFGKEVWPDNLWAVSEEDRKTFAWQP